MNRIAIISSLFGCMLLTSGCIEVSYKTEARLTLGEKKEPIARPRIVGNGYPNSPKTVPALLTSNEMIQSYDYNGYIMSSTTEPKHRGFKKFKRRER